MTNYTRHQEKIIRNYYDNREGIAIQRVQEIITELYLSEGKKRERQWNLLKGHLEKLGVKPPMIAKLIADDDPAAVATMLPKLMSKPS